MTAQVHRPVARQRYPAMMADQAMYADRQLGDGIGHFVVRFDGQVDAARMARALRLALDAEPVLGCRFVAHPWRPYWERRTDLDTLQHCPLVEDMDVDAALQRFLADMPRPATDLPLRAALFRGETDTLCIRIDHTVADGSGFLECVALLSSTYRALGMDPDYQPPYRGNLDRGYGPALRRIGLRRLARSFRYMPDLRMEWGFHMENTDRSDRRFAVRRLGPDCLADFKTYARQQQATLNDVLLTAFYRALITIIDPPPGIPLAIQNTTSLRRYRPAGEAAICNLVSIIFQAMPRLVDEPFAATLARVHVAQQNGEEQGAWLTTLVLGEFLYACGYAPASRLTCWAEMNQARRGNAAPIYANLGVIGPETVNFGEPGVESVTVHGPVTYSPLVTLTIHTFRGIMSFTSACSGGPAAAKKVERLLDLCTGELLTVRPAVSV